MNEENIDEQFIPADISEPNCTLDIFEKMKRKDGIEIPIPSNRNVCMEASDGI